MSKRNPPNRQSGRVRIIAGKWRGRRLSVSDADGLRPTTDRVRETLFNWLAPDIVGARCLDLFAGSGVLGFECLSRGASMLQLVEANRPVADQLGKTLQELIKDESESTRASVYVGDALDYLKDNAGAEFDVVFLDPPFKSNLSCSAIQLLERRNWLTKSALIYLEHPVKADEVAIPSNWTKFREGRAGESRYILYRRAS